MDIINQIYIAKKRILTSEREFPSIVIIHTDVMKEMEAWYKKTWEKHDDTSLKTVYGLIIITTKDIELNEVIVK